MIKNSSRSDKRSTSWWTNPAFSVPIITAVITMVGTVVAPVAPKLWEKFQQTTRSDTLPMIEGRKVDYCINSYPYGDGCSDAAAHEVAVNYCRYYGRSLDDTKADPYNDIWEQPDSILVKRWTYDQGHGQWNNATGGRIFQHIRCR
jgi:hypothetical protein